MAQVEPDAGQELLSERVAGSICPGVVGALLYLLGRCTEAAAQRGGLLPAAGSGS
jgi:hypothetical protein